MPWFVLLQTKTIHVFLCWHSTFQSHWPWAFYWKKPLMWTRHHHWKNAYKKSPKELQSYHLQKTCHHSSTEIMNPVSCVTLTSLTNKEEKYIYLFPSLMQANDTQSLQLMSPSTKFTMTLTTLIPYLNNTTQKSLQLLLTLFCSCRMHMFHCFNIPWDW